MPPPIRTTAADYHFYAYDYGGSAPYTLSPAQPSRGGLQFYSMVQDMGGLLLTGQASNVPNIALHRLGAQVADQNGTLRDINVLAFGGAVGNPTNDPGVLLTGGIHSREWVAPAITYLIAEYLIKNYSTNPVGVYQTALSNLINSRRIYIVPMLNPNGNNYTVFSPTANARMWRKNRRLLPSTAANWVTALTNPFTGNPNPPFRNVVNLNPGQDAASYEVPEYLSNPLTYDTITILPGNVSGVDLNRNYDSPRWGYDTANSTEGRPAGCLYFGPDHASEVETQNLQNYMNNLQVMAMTPTPFETTIDYHSYSQAILYPTEAFNTGRVNQNYKNLGMIMQRLIATSFAWTFSYDYSLGSAREVIGYDALGSITDHEAMTYPSRSYTIELDPASDNPGFLLPEDQIMGVFEKNIRAALAVIAAAGQASTVTAGGLFKRHTITSAGELQFLTWNVFNRGNRLPV